MRTACSANTRDAGWGRSASWRPRAFTRQRTPPVYLASPPRTTRQVVSRQRGAPNQCALALRGSGAHVSSAAAVAVGSTVLIVHLKSHGIQSVFHYVPLHLSDMGQRLGGRAGDCPVTEDISDRLLRLPFFNPMTEAEQARVVAAVRECQV